MYVQLIVGRGEIPRAFTHDELVERCALLRVQWWPGMFGRLLTTVRSVHPGYESFVRHFVLVGRVPLEWRDGVPVDALRGAVVAVADERAAAAAALSGRLRALPWPR
jgi:hypothetical protein